MSPGAGPPLPSRVPTLTEVIELGDVPEHGETPPPEPASWPDDAAAAPAATFEYPAPDADDLTAQVLADVQRQVEAMLEPRLREAVMPALLRATDALVLDLRIELANALHGLVARAVAQQLALRQADGRFDGSPSSPGA